MPSGLSPGGAETERRLREVLARTYFARCDPGYLDSPAGRDDLADHLHRRHEACLAHVVPWLARHARLEAAEIVEIGCGTGSSTAGFAGVARHVHGYDIDAPSVEAARGRMQVLGIANASLHCEPAPELLARLVERHAGGVDVILLYAVLEHQTIGERLESIRVAWELLREAGLLVVVETPNRLAFTDSHTSLLPFFHWLPDELALRYADRSPRPLFREAIARALEHSPERALETLARWGRGVGHHEFELVLGKLGDLVVASGYEPEMLAMFPLRREESILQGWFVESGLEIPLAFTRHNLNFILRKGGRRPGERDGPRPPALEASPGAELARRYAELEERCRAMEGSAAVRAARWIERHPALARVVRRTVRAARFLRRTAN
jgi:S-adenosylmethionine-dependent methyltransferase